MSFKIADAFVDVDWKFTNPRDQIDRALGDRSETIRVDADTRQASDKVSALQRALQRNEAAKVKVDADIVAAERKLAELKASAEAKIAAINAKSIKIDADTAAAEAKLARLRQQRLIGPLTETQQLKFDADTAAAEAKISALRVSTQQVRDARVRVDADIASAEAKLAAARGQADALDAKRAEIEVDADAGAAEAELAAANAAVSALDGRRANVTVDADVAAALAKIALVSSAIAALGVGAVAGLGAVGAIGAVVAGGIGAVGASVVGVKGAVDALGKANQSAGGSAGGASSNHLQLASAMDRVKSAQAALANTQANAADQVRRADQGVVDAKERLSRAYDDAAVSAEASARRVTDAEERLSDAQRDARLAQEDLTRARGDAARQLQDLRERVEDLALSEESAALSVREAEQRLAEVRADGRSTDLERARAELSYRESLNRLEDIRIEQQRTAEDKAAADAKGVDGSDQVTAANRRLIDAQEGVGDAERAVADARTQAARDARRDAEAIRDAQQRVTEAELGAVAARRQAAYQVAQAQQSIVDAQRAVQQASQQAGAAGGGGIDRVAQAMAGLSPVAREFALFLRGFIDGPLKELRQAGQNNLLPGLQRGLEALVPIMASDLTPAFAEFSKTLGDMFADAIPMAGRFASSLLTFGSDTLDALRPLGPIFDAFIISFDAMADRVAANGTLADGMSGLSAVLGALLGNLPLLIEVGLQVMGVIGEPLADAVNALLPAILALAEALGPLLAGTLEALVPLLESFTGFVTEHPALVRALTVAVVGLVTGFQALGPIGAVVGALSSPIGAVVAVVAALAAGIGYAYTHSATFRAEVGRMWEALQKAGSTIREMVGPALDRLGRAIKNDLAPAFTGLAEEIAPVVTWLVDKLGPAVGAWLTIVVTQAELAVKALSAVFDVIGWIVDKIPGIDKVKESFDDAATSSADYGDEVETMGRKSDDARRAQDELARAMDKVVDQALAGRSAERDYYEAVDRATQAVAANGRTLSVHTQAGRDNAAALDNQAARANAYTKSLADNGAAQKTLDSALATQRSSLVKTATQMGMTKAQAEAYADRVLKIPKTATTAVALSGYSNTMGNLQSLINRIALVNGKRVSIQVETNAANVREDRVAARAKGGPVERGVPYVVGEDRPELFVPDEPGMIIPDLGLVRSSLAPYTQRPTLAGPDGLASGTQPGGGGVRIDNLNIQLPAPSGSWDMASEEDRRRMADQMARAMRDAIVRLEGASR